MFVPATLLIEKVVAATFLEIVPVDILHLPLLAVVQLTAFPPAVNDPLITAPG
jgi:hypothetical protein